MVHTRAYPERPFVAVSAAIFNNSNEILIIKRAKEPGKGLWSIPGGIVKTGETLVEALQREISEECGIRVENHKFNAVYDRILYDKSGKVNYHYIIINYICNTKSNKIVPASDADDYSWLKSDELDRFKYTNGLKQYLKNLF
ncbi:NUDIX hydrolase [candidate division KSB1 bacterium]|nr:NUDIX hydrolase [candidate division KSB1 bacterium]